MAPKSSASVLTYGNVRFSVQHQHCIRIEYNAEKTFVDEPSLFALHRNTPAVKFSHTKHGKQVVIETSAIRLEYTPDGKPLSKTNLKATICHAEKKRTWHPGKRNTNNLGGTAETLDGWTESRPLADGLLSRDGWFLLDDSTRPLLTKNWVKERPAGGTDWYLFGYGSDYRAAFQALSTIAGAVPMPRRYTLGAWYSRYWPYSTKEFKNIVAEYEDHGFPLDVMVMDMDWHINDISRVPSLMKEMNRGDGQIWTGYTWDRELIPDPKKLLAWMHKNDIHVTLNDHPADGVRSFEAPYAPFMKAMGQDPKKGTTIPFDAGNKKYLETFYDHTHANLDAEGVDFWWLDWQQYRNTRSIPGLTNLEWLNYYYYKRSRIHDLRGQSFSRWGGWGDHRHPIHFSGDADTGWAMLAFEVPFTATAGNVGCFFWSHDIGGHQGGRNEESYTRWCQFGAMSAALRSHSTRDAEMDRRPWSYPKWAEASMRESFHLRSELFPYIYSACAQASHETVPFLRPMYIDYANENAAYENPQQYMLGDHLLVAPIAEPGLGRNRLARQIVWFPKGTWYNYFTGERFDGPCEQMVAADINEFPLYVRAGTPIPMQAYTPRMGTSSPDTLRIRCWPGEQDAAQTSVFYEDDGETEAYLRGKCARTRLTMTQHGSDLCLSVSPTEGTFKGQKAKRAYLVELPCVQKPTSALLDGKPVAVNYDARTCEAKISLPARSISKGFTLQVTTSASNPSNHALAAFFRRTCLKKDMQKESISASFHNILKSKDASLIALATHAVGAGLFAKTTHFYGHGDQSALSFYWPSYLDANQTITLSLGKEKLQAKRTGPCTKISMLPLLARTAPPETELLAGSSPLEWKASIGMGATTLRCTTTTLLSRPYWAYKKNLAPAARVTASSHMPDQPPELAVDGVVDGIPGNRFREWATDAETTGAWIRLDWSKAVTAGRVLLFDRPNAADHIVAGKLILSDGSVHDVGELPSDAQTPYVVDFSPRPIRWMVFVVTAVGEDTGWSGLAEIAVYAK